MTPFRDALFALLARQLGNQTDAEDALQEILFHAWRGLPTYRDEGRFRSWLFTIAFREVSSRRRLSLRRNISAQTEAPSDATSRTTPQTELDTTELHEVILATLTKLPEAQRDVFLLRQSSTLTFAEIAALMKQPLNTVLSHMHYALEKLRRAVREHA